MNSPKLPPSLPLQKPLITREISANPNRLIHEKSPYLLQHAWNPVDWQPWSEDAFTQAIQQNKPIFLSIGYSTCHWCHVMEKESFEDHEVAEFLNRHFVSIKVDREERPDIDATYMAACQLLTGSGGWPLTLLLTPDKKPFFAATYLPKNSSRGMHGLMKILDMVQELWINDRSKIITGGSRVLDSLKKLDENSAPAEYLDRTLLKRALQQYTDQFDSHHFGFGPAPKFPTPHNLSLLLRLSKQSDQTQAAEIALSTLRAIRRGGIYDQIGFGLHRYATDRHWLVPHFEKMLYDQALMILACIDAHQVSGDLYFGEIAGEIIEYLKRDLGHPEGGFYCGEDADSEGSEGTFYLWTKVEVEKLLDRGSADLFCRRFDISAQGNWEGKNIPHLKPETDKLTMEEFDNIHRARTRLLEARATRARPHKDDKILTGWNGLAIAALSRAGFVLDHPEWINLAEMTAEFIMKKLRRPDGRLLRRYRQNDAAIPGFLEDYSFFCWGLIELYQAGFNPTHLQWALELARDMDRLFGDDTGTYFDTGRDAEMILTRGRNLQDGAIPSGASLAALVQLRLSRLCANESLETQAQNTLLQNTSRAERYPMAYALTLAGLDLATSPPASLVICTNGSRSECGPFLDQLRSRFLPNLSVLVNSERTQGIDRLSPLAKGKQTVDNQCTAWLCTDNRCLPPVTTAQKLGVLLDVL